MIQFKARASTTAVGRFVEPFYDIDPFTKEIGAKDLEICVGTNSRTELAVPLS